MCIQFLQATQQIYMNEINRKEDITYLTPCVMTQLLQFKPTKYTHFNVII